MLSFIRRSVGAVHFRPAVAAELMFGALGMTEVRAIRRRLIDPFRPGRVIIRELSDYHAAGEVIRDMRARRGPHPELIRRTFWNDVVIAVSCRRRGVVLITEDEDHPRIQEFVGHRCRGLRLEGEQA